MIEFIASPTAVPSARITGISFNSKFDTAYVTYEMGSGKGQAERGDATGGSGKRKAGSGKGAGGSGEREAGGGKGAGEDARSTVSRVWINGKACWWGLKLLQAPHEKQPGLIVVSGESKVEVFWRFEIPFSSGAFSSPTSI
jgi:hypothetical protein